MLFLSAPSPIASPSFLLLQPQNDHGCLHDALGAAVIEGTVAGRLGAGVGSGTAVFGLDVGSLQPNQPGVSQPLVDIAVPLERDWPLEVLYEEVVMVSSRQPNHPGVLHVEVEVADARLDEVMPLDEVDSSKHPHHPGVLQVSVLVRECIVELATLLLVVELELLLSKYFQLKQSLQSRTTSQFAGSS